MTLAQQKPEACPDCNGWGGVDAGRGPCLLDTCPRCDGVGFLDHEHSFDKPVTQHGIALLRCICGVMVADSKRTRIPVPDSGDGR